jgi:UDP-GlcNAc:undecaprenyl-phosphate GlcNAc-1-phosphate transferase
MYVLLLALITAFAMTYLAVPAIIRVAVEKGLYDKPNKRSAHSTPMPSLGGIGIFAGMVCAVVLWTPLGYFGELQFILAAFVIIFLTGIQDDLMPISPNKKLIGQLLAAIILVAWSQVKITSFYGIFGLHVLPPWISLFLSIILIMGIINSFNLIDGINGLAGAIGLLTCFVLGSWFQLAGFPELAVVAIALAGSLMAFLKYNFSNQARIFMGDTGSMLVGTVCAILTIEFVELNGNPIVHSDVSLHAAPAVAIAVLFVPIFDMLRVFIRRMYKGRSPLSPDRGHIHHILIDSGLDHVQATALLSLGNLCLIVFTLVFHTWGNTMLISLEVLLGILISYILHRQEKVNHHKLVYPTP